MDYNRAVENINNAIATGNYNSAMIIAHQILDNYEKKIDGYQLTNVFSSIERFYLNIPNSMMYITYMSRLKNLYKKEQRYNELVDIMYLLVNEYVSVNETDLAYITCTEAMEIAKSNKYHIGECNLLNGFGNINNVLGDVNNALEYYENAFFLSQSIHYEDGKRFAHNLGYIYKKLGNIEESIRYLEIAYEYNATLSKKGIFANTCNEYGDALVSIENYELAEVILTKAYKLCKETNSNYFLKENYLFRSRLYELTNNPTEALECYKSFHEFDSNISKMEKGLKLKQFNYQTKVKSTIAENELIRSKNEELEAYSNELASKNKELHALLKEVRNYKESINIIEKQSAFSRMLMGISHNINTSIGNTILIISYLQNEITHLEDSLHNEALSKNELEKFIELDKINLDNMMKSYSNVVRFIDKIKSTPISIEELKKSNPLEKIVSNCISKYETQLEEANISVITKLDHPIPQLKGSRVFEDICNQLINNAIKFAFDSNEKNSIIIEADLDNNNDLNIQFSDNGKGIEPEKIKHIFDPFYTSNMGFKGGSGLGLYVVYKTITDVLGGNIKCISNYGGGTLFNLKLPNNGISFTKISN